MDSDAGSDQQTAIVTGAAQGIGLAIARRLATAGMHVVMTDLRAEAVSEAATALRREGLDVDASEMDATDPDHVGQAVDDVARRRGQVHVLVNNAGIYPYIPLDDLDLPGWRRIIQANTDSAFVCSREVSSIMREHGYGRIVNLASAVFFNGVGGAAYVTSKAANIGLTRSLALELGPHGITVNAVAPGLVDTEGLRDLGDRADRLFDGAIAAQIVKRPGEPADIAEAVAYLASPASSFVTGQLINVDGGANFH